MSAANANPEEFGDKRITSFQSICLLLNNITGAAMVRTENFTLLPPGKHHI